MGSGELWVRMQSKGLLKKEVKLMKLMRYVSGPRKALLTGISLSIFLVPATQAVAAGFYLGVEAGVAESNDIKISNQAINHPTRCDSLLYVNPANAPSEAACTDNTVRELYRSLFDIDTGFAGGFNLGYRFGAFRVEAEYLYRHQGGQDKPIDLGSAGNAALGTKDSEWDRNAPPESGIHDYRGQHFFLNAYYDFLNDSAWTPYLGAGVGMGRIRMDYQNSFLRRNDLGQLGPEEWRRAAAGTLSNLDTELSDTQFAFQALAGLDYALGERVSLVFKGRWTRIDGFTGKNRLWTKIRSHSPVLADGTTPFTSDLELDDVEHWTISAGLRYQF